MVTNLYEEAERIAEAHNIDNYEEYVNEVERIYRELVEWSNKTQTAGSLN